MLVCTLLVGIYQIPCLYKCITTPVVSIKIEKLVKVIYFVQRKKDAKVRAFLSFLYTDNQVNGHDCAIQSLVLKLYTSIRLFLVVLFQKIKISICTQCVFHIII